MSRTHPTGPSPEQIASGITPTRASSASTSRDPSVESIRGVAVVLVVLFHAFATMNLDHRDDPELAVIARLVGPLTLIRMPLFAALAGFAAGIVGRKADVGLASEVAARARRLLIPLVSTTTLILAIRSVVPRSSSAAGPVDHRPLGFLGYYLYSFEHLWFLQSLFVIAVVYAVVDRAGLLRTPGRWLLTTAIVAVASWIVPANSLFSLNGARDFSAYFLLGVGLGRFPQQIFRRPTVALLAMAAVVALAVHELTAAGQIVAETGPRSLSGRIVGLSAIPLIFHLRLVLPFFPGLAAYSYTIYLFHSLGLSGGSRAASRLLAGAPLPAVLVFETAFAVAFSVAVHHVVVSNRLLSLLFTGSVRRRRAESSRAPATGCALPQLITGQAE